MPQSDEVLKQSIDDFWEKEVLPQFKEYVTIPCISPSYDPKWRETGALEKAGELVTKWLGSESLAPLGAEVHTGPPSQAAPPVLLVRFPAHPAGTPGNVLSYGHLDKQTVAGEHWTQPPNVPQDKRTAFTPNIYDDHLYGRGTSDDGFATFTMVTALWALKQNDEPYPAVNVIIDFDEESGSANLEAALKHFEGIIGQPDLCMELDSSIGNYEQLWFESTARGTITGTLSIKMLSTAVHSGDGGGIVPNPITIARLLLDRLQDGSTGKVIVPEFIVPVPARNLADAQAQATSFGRSLLGDFPWVGNAFPFEQDPVQLVLDKTWRAALAVTGQAGLPPLNEASNVIIPELALQLSMRMPPSIDVDEAQQVLKRTLEADPPFGAEVAYDYVGQPIGAGWVSPPRAPWFEQAIQDASRAVFGRDAAAYSDGGTIPVLNLMTRLYVDERKDKCAPGAQILGTGAAGPGNNEHGANENLNMAYTRQLALALALMIQAASRNSPPG